LTLDDMAVSRSGLGSKGPCNVPYKKIQKAPKVPSKDPCKSPCDQHCIATMASLPLAVRSKLQICNKHYKMKFIYHFIPPHSKFIFYLIQYAKYCKYFICDFWRKFKKKNVYPLHKPAAVDWIMFTFGKFLSSSIILGFEFTEKHGLFA
jgi:hypothetical protein